MRAELAQRRLDDYLEERLSNLFVKLILDSRRCRTFIQELFRVLQYPRLNKQLGLVLMDVLVEKIRNSKIERLNAF